MSDIRNLDLDGPAGQGVPVDDCSLSTIIVTDGTDTYIAEARPGTATSAALWRARKVDVDGNTTWADGDGKFNNVATALSGLSYS